MDREEGVLQQGIERLAFDRRIGQPHEGAGRQGRVADEQGAEAALDRQHQRLQPHGQAAARKGHRRAIAGERQVPEQHGALVAPPYRGDLVDQRLGRVGVGRDVGHREVRADEGRHQGEEGDGDAEEGPHGRAFAGPLQRLRSARRAEGRQPRLGQRQRQSQDQAEGPELGDHGAPTGAEGAMAWSPGRHSPDFFRAWTTSLGI